MRPSTQGRDRIGSHSSRHDERFGIVHDERREFFIRAFDQAGLPCPGTVDTPSLDERLTATGDYASAWAAFTARQPMGRLGWPAEIASLALYLASDDSAFVTGQCHIIDGGWSN